MSYQKIVNLTKKIYQKSNDGSITWEATEQKNTYQVSFSDYSVRITKLPSKDFPDSDDYIIQIINSSGDIVEEMSDIDLKDSWDESFSAMKSIHEVARRQVMGVEQALDSILSELNN